MTLHRLASENHLGSTWVFDARTPSRQKVLDLARRIAPSSCPVLILGGTGVGKEVLATDVHRNSARAKGPFVSVNCAAITPELFESTLFGHVRGAFTGARVDRRGLVEIAHGGTLFLDEVGELHLDVQAKLLRFLSQGTFWPVGASAERRADVRIIAATHRDLEKMKGYTFREDLYYRLSVLILRIPRLEPRDIHAIAETMVLEAMTRHGMNLSPREVEGLASHCAEHHWPGGARELRNMIDRLLVLRDPQIELERYCVEMLGSEIESTGATSGVRTRTSRAVVTRDLDDLIFLGIAEESRDVRDLAQRSARTLQAVYTRLKKLGLETRDLGPTPQLQSVAQQLRERLAPNITWIRSLLEPL